MRHAAFERSAARSCAAADAFGKINLTLDVLGRRDDGYHDLRSLVMGVGLADHVRCRALAGTDVALRCSDPTLESEDNLAVRAARALGRHWGRALGLSIDLTKNIPVGAGLGGGSSNAATTLRLCNHVHSAGLDRAVLSGIGAAMGSDVALFFHLPAAVITGRGECVEPIPLRWSGWVLLVFPGPAVLTADVYRAWRRSDAASLPTGLETALTQATTADELSAMLRNHLEPAVFRVAPAVAQVHEELRRRGYRGVRVSGAGSALFQLFDEEDAARHAAERIEGSALGVKANVVTAPMTESPIVEI